MNAMMLLMQILVATIEECMAIVYSGPTQWIPAGLQRLSLGRDWFEPCFACHARNCACTACRWTLQAPKTTSLFPFRAVLYSPIH
jgi:hypothetical protein